jgi:Raf kinase inhibitor-like YbhB/YbcL family protein
MERFCSEPLASAMELFSPAFAGGGPIPRIHSGEGEDLSPPLQWRNVPPGVVSFALILDDPDAPPGLWIHWVLYDLPAQLRALPAGLPRSERLEGGGVHGACWGVESFSRQGYHGPLPPPGPPHRYHFELSALDRHLHLPAGATAAAVRSAMAGHVLARAELVGLYGRG